MVPTARKEYVTAKGLSYVGFGLLCCVLALGLISDYPYAPFVFVLAVFWILVNLKWPFVGLLFYSIFILVRPHEFITALSFPMIEKAIVAPVILGLAVKFITVTRHDFRLGGVEKSVTSFVAVAFLSIITSVWITGAWNHWFDLFRLFVIFIFISQLIDTKKQFRLFAFFFILTGGFHAVSAIINYYRGVRGFAMGIDRAIGLDLSYGAPNSLAATIVYTLPFLYFYFAGTRSKPMRLFLGLLAAACVWCIILTGSRTGMIGVIFVIFMIALHYRNRVRNMIIGALVLMIAFVVMPQQYRDRLASTTDLSSGSGAAISAQGRIDGLDNGMIMLIDRPLLGVGIGQYPIALGSIYGKGYWEAHILLGQLAGDLGLLGLAVFSIWLWILFGNLRRLARLYPPARGQPNFMFNMALALRMEILCLFVMGLGGHNLYRYNWFVASALVVVMLRLARDRVTTSLPDSSPAEGELAVEAVQGDKPVR